jgi:hypothetical protein
MKEPKPLLREGASDFERQLLGAVLRERPSRQLRSRMRRTLGLTGPLAWAGSVKAMLMSFAGKSALGLAVVGLVAAGFVGTRSLQADPGDSPSNVARETPAVVKESAPPAQPPAQPVASPLPETSAPAAAPNTRHGELREEILLLDQARAALQHGSRAQALEQLDGYRQRFPSGILSREAALLRQQAASAGRIPAAAH